MEHPINHTAPARWVVMGVCGCGKSEIGRSLAAALDVRFLEGDAFHSAANVAKMAAGTPLDDSDRADWLLRLQAEIAAARARGEGLVLACSALKERYRDVLRAADRDLRFAHLTGERSLIAGRMQARTAHYMPTSLLDSQLRDLEPLGAGEAGIALDVRLAPPAIITEILHAQGQ
jgi:carbohydrate kinase (thermoresistant glucokinase family)